MNREYNLSICYPDKDPGKFPKTVSVKVVAADDIQAWNWAEIHTSRYYSAYLWYSLKGDGFELWKYNRDKPT